MSIHSIMPFITALLFGSVGSYVFFKHKRAPESGPYAFWCYTTVHWHLVWAYIYSNPMIASLDFLTRFCYSGIVFIPIAFYHFIISFLRDSKRNRRVKVAYFLGGLFVTAIWTGHTFVIGTQKYWWGYYPRVGWMHVLYLGFLAYLVWDGLTLLMAELKKPSLSEMRRNQVRYVIGTCVVYVFASIDFLPNYGISIYPIGFVFTIISWGLVTYAIAAHHLLDVHVIIRKTLIYSLVSTTLACVYVGTITFLAHFLERWHASSSAVSSALAAVFITLLFNPLRHRVQHFIDRYFFRESLDQAILREATSGFVHEIKRPLARIGLPAELSIADLEDLVARRRSIEDVTPRVLQRLRYILSQTTDAGDKIEAIQEVSTSDGKPMEEVDLKAVIKRGLEAERELLDRHHIQIELDMINQFPALRGHARQLEIVVSNLVKNAAEALSKLPPEAPRTISIITSFIGSQIKLKVKDSGPGITQEDLRHLFEPYFTTKGPHGMGMGLFLCRQIIQAHGGSILAKRAESGGAVFEIVMPVPAGNS